METKNFPGDCWKRDTTCCIIIYVIRKHAAYYRKRKIGEMIMSKLKKKAFAVILGGALSIMSCLPVFAAEPGISPHYKVALCNQCNSWSFFTNRTGIYRCTERIDGILYKIYNVTVESHCDNCSYNKSESYTEYRRQ